LSVPAKQDPKALGFFSAGGKFFVLGGKNTKGDNIESLFAVPSGESSGWKAPVFSSSFMYKTA
jgi:hypothetical protein